MREGKTEDFQDGEKERGVAEAPNVIKERQRENPEPNKWRGALLSWSQSGQVCQQTRWREMVRVVLYWFQRPGVIRGSAAGLSVLPLDPGGA